MKHIRVIPKVALSALSLLVVGCCAYAGEVSFECTSVTVTGGTAASTPAAFTTEPEDAHGSLELRSLSSGQNHTLTGDVSFRFEWTPAFVGETPPGSISVTVTKSVCLTVEGNGYGSVFAGSTIIEDLYGSDNLTSGFVALKGKQTHTVGLTQNLDGTVTGTLVIPTDSIETHFNSSTSTITTVSQTFTVYNVQ